MGALHAEWTKLRTVAGPAWLLIAAVAATAAIGAAVAGGAHCPVSVGVVGGGKEASAGVAGGGREAGCGLDPAKISLSGVYLGQAVVAVLGVLAIGNEYSTGMIRVTLTAMPRRLAVLAAKAATLTGPVLLAAAVAAAASALAGRFILPGHGFTAAHGFASLTGPAGLRAAVGTALYLTLIALLSLGVATAIRDSAAAIGIVLGLLYLFPIVASLVTDPHLARHLQQIGPMSAGLYVQATTDLRGLPLTPWQGLGVLALWAAGALIAGALVLRLRDA